ncbi:MAG: Fic family protein [Anaerolineae bacterium]|nr:Fic family protein [Anaerolineae bacterium]
MNTVFAPQYRITPTLLDIIKRVAVLVHDLNRHTLPDMLLAELQTEAAASATFASTSIEGNPLPLTEVRRLLKQQPANLRNSEREVINYNTVLSALHGAPERPFDEAGLLAIHAGVMDGLLPGYQIGRYRREPVVIRDPRTRDLIFLPPDWQDVPALMAQLVAFVQEQRGTLDPLLLAGLFHKQFVIIHPFMDGNGRTARLATKQLLAALGLNLFPLLSFENGYNRNVTRYFQQVGLRGNYYDVATTADFTDWLEYFADGILDELLRLQETVSARSRTPDTRLQPHHEALLAFIDTHGFITDRDYAQLTDRAKATRTLDFRKLIDLGLIERRGRGRNTHYVRGT